MYDTTHQTEPDNSYEKIIAEYKISLVHLNEKIKKLRSQPDAGKKLSQLYQMRAEVRQSIKSMTRYQAVTQEGNNGIC